MEFSSSNPLLVKYRSDRRKLLEFLISSGLIKDIKTPPAQTASISSIDFDSLSADYVLECILSGGVLDVSQAMKRYCDESSHPVVRHLQSGDVYYLRSDPDSAGSPPCRGPPPITNHRRDFVESRNSEHPSYVAGERSPMASQETWNNCQATAALDINSLHDTNLLPIGLPTLKTESMKDYWMMTCGSLLMKSFLHVCCSPGLKFTRPRVEREKKVLDFFPG